MVKQKKKFSVRRLFKSFGYAFRGIRQVIYWEQNAKVHSIAAIGVIAAGLYFHLSPMEWVAIVIVVGGVFAAETFNTAIEELSDTVSPEYDVRIKHVKDFAAGAVLIMAMVAFVVGLLIFIPKIL